MLCSCVHVYVCLVHVCLCDSKYLCVCVLYSCPCTRASVSVRLQDGTLKIWHSTTYRLESTLNHHMDRLWCMAYDANSLRLALGYDFGCMLLTLGSSNPVVDMDSRSGKIIWAKNSDLQQVNVKASIGTCLFF